MMHRRSARLFVGFLFLALPWAEAAFFSSEDRFTTGPDLWKSGGGVRPLALGGTGVALAEDPSAIGWNPGALNELPQSEVLFQRDNGFDGQTRHFLSFAKPYWSAGGRRTWALAIAAKQEPEFDLIDDGATLGTVNPLDLSLSLGAARPLGAGHAGLVLKGYYGRTYQHESQAIAVDAGYRRSWPGRGALGISMANLGVSFPKEEPPLPLVLRAGGAKTLWAQRRNRWELAGSVEMPYGSPLTGQGGLDYARRLSDTTTLAVRAGYRGGIGESLLDGATAGLGLDRGALRINYALTVTEALGAMHRFELGWRMGDPLAKEVRQNELWRSAQEDVRHNRWSAARETLNVMAKEYPGFSPGKSLRQTVDDRLKDILDPETLFQIGLSYLENKDYEKAVDYFEKLLLARPEHVEGQAALAKARALAGPTRAETAVDDKRRDIERRVRRALDDEKWEAALEAARRLAARESGPLGEDLREARRRVYAEAVRQEGRGNVDEAIRLFEFLVSHGGEGDSAHRLAVLREARDNMRRARSTALYQEGVKAYANGDMDRARALFKEALTFDPDDTAARRALERLDVDRRR